jgi:hypothetical protein
MAVGLFVGVIIMVSGTVGALAMGWLVTKYEDA